MEFLKQSQKTWLREFMQQLCDSAMWLIFFISTEALLSVTELCLIPDHALTHVVIFMASGVKVTDEVIAVFNDMKVRKAQANEDEKRKRKKAILFCMSKDLKNIVLDDGKEILLGDLGTTVQDPYQHFVKMLPPDDCRYALYDATYETKETKKEDLVFIFWAPESAPLKSKMIYASSKDAIKRKFEGIKHEWQVNGLEDLKDRHTLAEKLGGSSVVSLEGAPI